MSLAVVELEGRWVVHIISHLINPCLVRQALAKFPPRRTLSFNSVQRLQRQRHTTKSRHQYPPSPRSRQNGAQLPFSPLLCDGGTDTQLKSTSKVKTTALWNKSKDELKKQLDELKTELVTLRTQKIAGGASSKLTRMYV